MRSTSGSWMTIRIFLGLPVDVHRDSLRSTSGIWVTIGKV